MRGGISDEEIHAHSGALYRQGFETHGIVFDKPVELDGGSRIKMALIPVDFNDRSMVDSARENNGDRASASVVIDRSTGKGKIVAMDLEGGP